MCTPVISAVSYLSIGLAGCSVDPRISYGARKLARTPRFKKKNCLWNGRKKDPKSDSESGKYINRYRRMSCYPPPHLIAQI